MYPTVSTRWHKASRTARSGHSRYPLTMEPLEARMLLAHAPGLPYHYEVVARTGQPAPGGGTFESYLDPVDITNRGEIAFNALITSGEGDQKVEQEAVFVGRSGELTEVMRSGEPAPGGGTMKGLEGESPFSLMSDGDDNIDHSDIALTILIEPEPGGPHRGVRAGLYRYSGTSGGLEPVVVPGVTPAPGGGEFQAASTVTDMNNRGDIVFTASASTDNGIFRSDTLGNIEAVVVRGDSAPAGGTFGTARRPSINAGGDVAFEADIAEERCQQWCPAINIYTKNATTGEIRTIARLGEPEPGGAVYEFIFGPMINDQGDVLFESSEVTADGMVVESRALFHSNGETVRIAGPGDSMPGGGTIVETGPVVWDYYLNNRGDIAFDATLDTDDNVDGRGDTGLYMWSQGSIQLVARTGTAIPGVGAIAHVQPLIFLGFELDFPYSGSRLNDRGQVLFESTLDDGTCVLLVATPLSAGDANGDLQFDQQDIAQVQLAAKYLTEEPATFEEGDWNGDGEFDQLDIVTALRTGNYLQGPYAADVADAVFSDIVR